MTAARVRMIRLELKHAAAAIERARLLAAGTDLERDISRLLENANATVNLVTKETEKTEC